MNLFGKLFFRGILKNRPVLGEQVLQELVDDGLLKFNYFLVDSRGRGVKSYLKVPPPIINDPMAELIKQNLAKHGIQINEYALVFEKSSIPSNNKLSTLTIGIFQSNVSFVSQYVKYKDQLQVVIQQHVQNRSIQENEDGTFYVTDTNVFSHQYNEIENIMLRSRQNQLQNQPKTDNSRKQTTDSLTEFNQPKTDNSRKQTTDGLEHFNQPKTDNSRKLTTDGLGQFNQPTISALDNERSRDVIEKETERIDHLVNENSDMTRRESIIGMCSFNGDLISCISIFRKIYR